MKCKDLEETIESNTLDHSQKLKDLESRHQMEIGQLKKEKDEEIGRLKEKIRQLEATLADRMSELSESGEKKDREEENSSNHGNSDGTSSVRLVMSHDGVGLLHPIL